MAARRSASAIGRSNSGLNDGRNDSNRSSETRQDARVHLERDRAGRVPRMARIASSTSSSSSASPPPLRPRRQTTRPPRDPTTEDEEDDPDFGTSLRREVARDSELSHQKGRRQVPDRRDTDDNYGSIRRTASVPAPATTAKRKGKAKKELDIKPEERALLLGIEPGKSTTMTRFTARGKRKTVEKETDEDDDDDNDTSERPTKPTFDWARKRRETERLHKIKYEAVDFVASAVQRPDAETPLPCEVDFSQEEVLRHLKRRWCKKDPLAMSGRRKLLEQKYNPLIRLLNVRITVIEDGEDANDVKPGDSDLASSSDDDRYSSDPDLAKRRTEKRRSRRTAENYVARLASTDDEDGHELADREKGLQTQISEIWSTASTTDWNTDGLEGASAVWPAPAFAFGRQGDVSYDASPKMGRSSSQCEDVKPILSKSTRSSLDEPAIPSAIELADIKSRVASSVRNVVAMNADSDVDFVEPETEPSDVDEAAVANDTVSQISTLTPSQSVCKTAEQIASEIEMQESLLQKRTDLLQSQSAASQVASGIRIYANDGSGHVTGDESEEIDEQTLRMMKQEATKVQAVDERKAKLDRKMSKHRPDPDETQIKPPEEVAQVEDRGDVADHDSSEELEDEPAAWEMTTKKDIKRDTKPNLVLPYSIKRGRPKFIVESLEQHRTGPHLLPSNGSEDGEIPAPINKFLRPYQREGVEFLWGQWQKGMGGILGDDMGLGKTIQVIAFLSAVMGKKGFSKFDSHKRKNAINASDSDIATPSDLGPTCLIACPASVRNNWEREFATWGYFDVAVYEGTKEQRANTLLRFNRGYIDVLIVGLESVRDQIEDFSRLDITLLIIDEAHRLKNPKASLTRAFHQFPTPFRYGLTGTAIQNNLDELWCLLTFANPGQVGNLRQWQDLVTKPLKFAQQREASEQELALGRSRASALVGLLLPHFWLRRTKESVQLQLPRKRDNIVLCPLTDLQKAVYRRILEVDDVQLMLTADEPCYCGEKDAQGLPYRKGSCCEQGWTKLIFKYIVLFQKISNHLALMYPDRSEAESNPEKYQQDLQWIRIAFPDDYEKRKPGRIAFADPDLCGKWTVLCELLDLWYRNGDKVLIFSMSLKVLDLLSDLMETTYYKYLVLDGKTPAKTRMDLVDQFNDPEGDKFAFLVSTRAGGVGLNLKAANKVVIFDPNWNPSHDLQAMDRSHRFGQTKEVDVYRLIGAGTLEELILNRQQYKRAQAGVGYDATSERRLYSGVQGEGKEKQGELWGVANIFKFSENFSLLEMSIRQMQLDEMEYALTTELDDDDDDDLDRRPGVTPDYGDTANAEHIVAQVTGLKAKDEKEKDLTPAQIERARRHEEEQAKISAILGGRITVQSDATLGGSKVEEFRSREALRIAMGAKPRARPRQSTVGPARAIRGADTNGVDARKVKRPLSSDEDEDDLHAAGTKYDPYKRGKKVQAAPSRA